MYTRQFMHSFRDAVSDSDIPAPYKLLLFTMGNHAKSEGQDVRPSQATLARKACSSERSVRRHLQHLQEAGWVEVTKRGHSGADGRSSRSANRYQLRVGSPFTISRGQVHLHEPDTHSVSIPPIIEREPEEAVKVAPSASALPPPEVVESIEVGVWSPAYE